ncbi:MAG: GspH/FimT family pseudopilin [Steroidobacteraceae bacterium]
MHRVTAARAEAGRKARARGMTMIELLITVVVMAILMAIAVPSFRNASLGSQLSAAANNLLASVQLARSEAIKRNSAVTLCASADGTTCAGSGGWEQGWIIMDAGAAVLQRQESLPDRYLVSQAGGTVPLNFQPIGVGATAAAFTVCRDNPDGGQERIVTVSATGSARVTITNTGSCS